MRDQAFDLAQSVRNCEGWCAITVAKPRQPFTSGNADRDADAEKMTRLAHSPEAPSTCHPMNLAISKHVDTRCPCVVVQIEDQPLVWPTARWPGGQQISRPMLHQARD